MYIFTYNNYGGGKEESRFLLKRAVDAYQSIADVRPKRDASELVAEIQYGEKGKPYIPGWHAFSISHSNNTWVVSFNEYECGIDVQYEKDVDISAIADRLFCKEDCELIAGDESEFFRMWTRKEAAIKAVGESVFSVLPPLNGLTVELNGEEYYLFDLELLGTEDGCHAAVCVSQIPMEINYYGL